MGLDLLVEEIAYEQWHRMLFARFLAENDLLLHPEGAPVSLEDVRELAAEAGERDPWVLAARYAAAMLPGIFRADDPANRVALAPEDRSRLEAVLERLPTTLFTADDALGWVYQFWQSDRKDDVNKKGNKIGGADLPPVTQLFTEHYMVRFLLENSLGAWWAGRHSDSPLVREWEYLRFRNDGSPAAGTFDGWPARAAEVTVMDPCCGSGHFLTAAADMLRRMRQEEEGLTAAQAAAAVLRDNLFGLELDARCLQLAAFNLALDAWKAGGYQPLSVPNLACTGIAIQGQRADWARLAGGDANMAGALDRLYDQFQDAPELGSLIDPRAAAGEGFWAVDPDQLLDRLDQALRREVGNDPAAAVFGAAAAGTAKAAKLLGGRYWLVTTNPPFLAASRQTARAANYLAATLPTAKYDLAVAMLLRWRESAAWQGSLAFVTPQAWLFSGWYQGFRRELLTATTLALIGRLGAGAFDAVSGEVVNVALVVGEVSKPDDRSLIHNLDVAESKGAAGKSRALRQAPIESFGQLTQLANPEARIAGLVTGELLAKYAEGRAGICSGDYPRFGRFFWELSDFGTRWSRQVSTVSSSRLWGGREHVFMWDGGQGAFFAFVEERLGVGRTGAWIRGTDLGGRVGVAVSSMGNLPVSLYQGELFDNNTAAIVLRDPEHLAAAWAYCSSPDFARNVRQIDQSLKVTNESFVKVPFDLEHWSRVAAEQYPDGLPEPYSDDPTQWLFQGKIVGSESPLQVAVAQLLGYRWPDQEPDELDAVADTDGLVPLVSVSGERPAADRLRGLLARAYGADWTPDLVNVLLEQSGSSGKTLESWLRDDFFTQHAKLFANRPFIWHIWDGRKDGFSVLCHYHRLDRERLSKLTFTLLGEWIERQRLAGGEPGAEARLAAALRLQQRLALILAGEAPHDVYVRWKPMSEQPIGWDPDLDDGVRLNIRPFVLADVLRPRVNLKWDKDRGRNPDGSERINDLHPTLAERQRARDAAHGSR